MGADRDNPTLEQVVAKIANNEIDRRQRSFAGIVTAAELDGKVTVQPAIRIAQQNGTQLPAKPVTLPVAWPSWGQIVMQGKLAVGDEVLVTCLDKNWLPWLVKGGIVDDTGGRGARAGYAYAEPRMVSKPTRPPDLPPTTVMRIGRTDGLTTVELAADGSITLAATDVFLSSGTGVGKFLTDFQTQFKAWVPAPMDGGLALDLATAAWQLLPPPTGGTPPP